MPKGTPVKSGVAISSLQTLRKVLFLSQIFPFYAWSCRLKRREILSVLVNQRPGEREREGGREESEFVVKVGIGVTVFSWLQQNSHMLN